MITANKIFLRPKTVDEALEYASQYENSFKYIAGGTDVLVNRFQGNDISECLIDITGIDGLSTVNNSGDYLRIGSLVKLSELKNYNVIKTEFPALIEAATSVGSPLIRNSATIGGNLLCENRCFYFNQSEWWRHSVGFCLKCEGDICIATGTNRACYSEFVSDTAPVLISMGAQIEVADVTGTKVIKLEEIYTGDGVNPINLSRTAIITSILVPLKQRFRSVFKKLRQRESLEFTSLTTSVTVDKDNNLSIAISGVDPKPIVLTGTTKTVREGLIKEALSKCRSVDNDMLTRKYRREMIKEFLTRSFEQLF